MKDNIAASSRTNCLSQTTKQYWTQEILLSQTGSEHYFDSSVLQWNHMVSSITSIASCINDVHVTVWFGCIYATIRFHPVSQKGFPSSRIWTSDLWITALSSTVHRSTNWAIDGYIIVKIKWYNSCAVLISKCSVVEQTLKHNPNTAPYHNE